MFDALGPSHWWPGETPFEVAVGAILTQNTNWSNVEKAIINLKSDGSLTPKAIKNISAEKLEKLIRPAGFFRMKTKKLKNLVRFLETEAEFEINTLRNFEMEELRPKILAINGVGPETADSILNYALDMPAFVVDTYTGRMMHRHGLIAEEFSYEQLQSLFTDHLDPDPAFYNEFHALIVRTGNNWCKKSNPKCDCCPLAFDLE